MAKKKPIPAKASKSQQSKKPVKAAPAKPSKPAKPVKSSKPLKPVKAVKNEKQHKPTKALKPAKPGKAAVEKGSKHKLQPPKKHAATAKAPAKNLSKGAPQKPVAKTGNNKQVQKGKPLAPIKSAKNAPAPKVDAKKGNFKKPAKFERVSKIDNKKVAPPAKAPKLNNKMTKMAPSAPAKESGTKKPLKGQSAPVEKVLPVKSAGKKGLDLKQEKADKESKAALLAASTKGAKKKVIEAPPVIEKKAKGRPKKNENDELDDDFLLSGEDDDLDDFDDEDGSLNPDDVLDVSFDEGDLELEEVERDDSESKLKESLTEEILALSEDFSLRDILDSFKTLDFFKGESSECMEKGCENPETTMGYCRYHYIKNWTDIKRKQGILQEGKLQALMGELVERFPVKNLEAILNDLADDKTFYRVLQELNIETGNENFDEAADDSFDEDDFDFAFEAKAVIRGDFEEEP